MTPESGFLISLGQALATMSLYDDGHPARERALEAAFDQLLALTATTPTVEYSFLGSEAIVGNRAMTELGSWDWAAKLSAARVERIEVDAEVDRESFEGFLDELFRQVSGRCVDTALARQLVRPPIRFGRIKVKDPGKGGAGAREGSTIRGEGGAGSAAAAVSMAEEISAIRWIHGEVQASGRIPMAEVETVIHTLAAAMRQDEQMLMPLLVLKQYDQYTTTHACNVSVLSMGLAERLGLSAPEVRAIGVAGLLHDIGKVAIPHELLVKPGRYTDAERAIIQRHPVDGARMIIQRDRGLGLAAVVAYEHHIFLNGEGYPALRFPRACHYASRIVHVCDIYDALCTDRPYRQAWEPEQALAYLQEQAGRELDPDIVNTFTEMICDALIQRIELPEPPRADGARVGGESAPVPHLQNAAEGATVLPARGRPLSTAPTAPSPAKSSNGVEQMADEQLTPIAPSRVAQELKALSDGRSSGKYDKDEYEHRFSRMISELRDRRISGTRAEIMAALSPLKAEGVISAEDWDRLVRQLGLN